MMLAVMLLAVDGFAEEQVVFHDDVAVESVPDTGFYALVAWLFTAVGNAGLDEGIGTKVSVAERSAPLLSIPRTSVIG